MTIPAKMPEKKMRKLVLDMLRPIGAFPVENYVHDGVPDVATTLGWIELKVADRPARSTTIVDVVMRTSQRKWHRDWRSIGGQSWTLTLLRPNVREPEHLWLLHDGAWSSHYLGVTTEQLMRTEALAASVHAPTSAACSGVGSDFIRMLRYRLPVWYEPSKTVGTTQEIP